MRQPAGARHPKHRKELEMLTRYEAARLRHCKRWNESLLAALEKRRAVVERKTRELRDSLDSLQTEYEANAEELARLVAKDAEIEAES